MHETDERIEAILPELDERIGGGLITLERAKVIMYRPEVLPDERRESQATDITGSWTARTETEAKEPPRGGAT